MALTIWKVVQKCMDGERGGRNTPHFPLMEASRPLEDRWAEDSLNQQMATHPPSKENECLYAKETFKVILLTPPNALALEVSNARAALASLMNCTLPLGDLLKVRPGSWDNITCKLHAQVLPDLKKLENPRAREKQTPPKKVPLNKVSGQLGPTEGIPLSLLNMPLELFPSLS